MAAEARSWLRFRDHQLEAAFLQQFHARQAASDVALSTTIALLLTVMTLRAARSDTPGATLTGCASVALAALPLLLLLLCSRPTYAALRGRLWIAWLPLMWAVGASTATAALQCSDAPLRHSFTSLVLQSTQYHLWVQLLARLPFQQHLLAHALSLVVNASFNVPRINSGTPLYIQQRCMQLAAVMRRCSPVGSLLALMGPGPGLAAGAGSLSSKGNLLGNGTATAAGSSLLLGSGLPQSIHSSSYASDAVQQASTGSTGASASAAAISASATATQAQQCISLEGWQISKEAMFACLATILFFQLLANALAAMLCWALELRQRRAFAAQHCPLAKGDLPQRCTGRLLWALPLLPFACWELAELVAEWQTAYSGAV